MNATTRDVFGDNNEATRKASRWLKLSEGEGRAVEKPADQFVLIRAPEATNSSPHYRKEHKEFKHKNSTLTFLVQQSQMIRYHETTVLSQSFTVQPAEPLPLVFRVQFQTKRLWGVVGPVRACGSCTLYTTRHLGYTKLPVHSNRQNIDPVIQTTGLRKHLLIEELNYSTGRTNTSQQGMTVSVEDKTRLLHLLESFLNILTLPCVTKMHQKLQRGCEH